LTIHLCLIAAMARNRVIGRAGKLPWRLPAELQYFKSVTMGKPIIMGRKTFESIGRPLPGRTNIIVTRQADFVAEGTLTASDFIAAKARGEAIARDDGVDEIMVIGGGEIYAQALPHADRIYLTEVQAEIGGDTVFPALDPAIWHEKDRVPHPSDGETPGYDFLRLER